MGDDGSGCFLVTFIACFLVGLCIGVSGTNDKWEKRLIEEGTYHWTVGREGEPTLKIKEISNESTNKISK